ncbi:MAG: hypothetical protein ACR2K5_01530 [Pseudolabrys sp.]
MAEKSPAQQQRSQRLARELRENLKRRKTQARARRPATPSPGTQQRQDS